MNDPWRAWEQDRDANSLLDRYAQRGSETPYSRIALEGESAVKADATSKSHAILLALGWVEPVWSEASPRGKPLGYKLAGPGKEWLQKAALRTSDQAEEESA